MKRFVLLLLCISLLSTSCVFAVNRVLVESEYAEFINVEPQVVNGMFYIPVRNMAENMGYTVKWRADSKEVVVRGDNREVIFNIRYGTYSVNGIDKIMPNEIAMLNGYTLIPLNLWGEIYNKYVYWDSNEAIGVMVTPVDISMEEYLQVVKYCGRITLFNSAYAYIKENTTSLIDTYSKTKDTELLRKIREGADNDLLSVLDEIKNMEVPDFAQNYKEETLKLCTTKYDYIDFYLNNVDKDRSFNEPVEKFRDDIVKQNLIVTAQLRGFFNKAAVISQDMDSKYTEEVNEFSSKVSDINEEMLGYLYHVNTDSESLNDEIIKYGKSLKVYAREYKIHLKEVSDTVFSDDTFEDNVKAINFILDSISSVGDCYISCGNSECSLDRAVLESSYIDFVWENIYMFVIVEHFGFSFEYIASPQTDIVAA